MPLLNSLYICRKNAILFALLSILLFCTQARAFSVGTVSLRSLDRDSVRFSFYFPIDDSFFHINYQGNESTIRRLDSLMAILRFSDIHKVSITAASSPEGPVLHNRVLTSKRMETFRNLLLGRYPILRNREIHYNSLPASWIRMPAEIGTILDSTSKKEVEDIITSPTSEREKERNIRRLDRGNIFKLLSSSALKSLRIAQVELVLHTLPLSKLSAQKPFFDTLICTKLKADISHIQSKTVYVAPLVDTLPLTIKSNLLYDALLMANIAIEYPLGKKLSINASWVFPWWNAPQKPFRTQQHSGELELRYWFKQHSNYRKFMNGWYAALFGGAGLYDVMKNGIGYRGDYFISAGISGGYVHRINKHFGLEYSLGMGYMKTCYSKYEYKDDCYYWLADGELNWVGPVKAAVTLIWSPQITFKRNKK